MRPRGIMDSQVLEAVINLRGYKERHTEVFSSVLQANEGKIYALDLFAAGTLNRSVSLLRGFCDLIESENYLCAVPLLRLQVDNCLRFFAPSLASDPNGFAIAVLEGKHIRNMNDHKGHKMTDKYLCDQLAITVPWITAMYDKASAYVHLSDQHLLSAIRAGEEEGLLEMKVGDVDAMLKSDDYIRALHAFEDATNLLFHLMNGWGRTKAGYGPALSR
jgi:hypothetical protein